MWDFAINGVDFYHLINWFFIYSFFGWLWETCFVSAKKGELVNRGFINGPFCTIYGFGALAVYLILKPAGGSLLLLFFGGIIVATTLEYITAVLMESIFHTSWWDYSDKKFNFQGRICLGASLGWGFFTVLLFRVLQPVVVYITNLYSENVGKVLICILAAGYAVDFCFSAAAAFRLHERIPAWEQALDDMQGELLIKVREKMAGLERASGITFEEVKERLDGIEILKELEGRRISMMKDISAELQKYKEAMAAKVSPVVRRYVKSYPNLNRGYKLHQKKKKRGKEEKKAS